MELFEFEGKMLFARAGIPVPKGRFITNAGEAPEGLPVMLKAQVLTGGRGKAGGVRKCATAEEYRRNADEILGMDIKGHAVRALLEEEVVDMSREVYLALTMQGVSRPTLIASACGGMDIEQTAAERPDEIIRMEINPFTGIQPHQLGYLKKRLDMLAVDNFDEVLTKLVGMFFDLDALLVEVNPMGVVDGRLVAMDAKVVLDDQANYRHSELFTMLEAEHLKAGHEPKKGDGTTITFIPLEGETALISDGAGTGMLALDMICQEGGSVASFCELGGTTPAETMYKAMEYSLKGRSPKSVLIVLIGGFNRMDDMANGITSYLRDNPVDVPIFTRMCGTMEEEGYAIMKRAGLFAQKDLADTVRRAVDAARGGN